MNIRAFALIFFLLSAPEAVHGDRPTMVVSPAPTAVIGEMGSTRIEPPETLMELALRKGVGFQNLAAANPHLDPWLPPAGAIVTLPTATTLPVGIQPGITINLAEYRLYYLWRAKGRHMFRVYPIGIGSEGWNTPEGDFAITAKAERPAWTVPLSIRRERPELPPVVPPGPENPLGEYWLQLSARGYGIHGTNQPLGVGRRVSHGCIRLYPDDIRDLFARVKIGTPVRILYQPIKMARRGNQLLLEVHADHLGQIADPLREVLRQKQLLGWRGPLHYSTLMRVLREARGVPVPLLLED
ncbi:MAG: L,D-transpeptidase family protein [Desulfuromonadales bacterium]